MDLIDRIKEIAQRIPRQIDHIKTEEATKTAFVLPFIGALGYDVFNPLEVIPEFTADIGTKKGEKVDYAIKKDDSIIMLFECKWCGCDLDECHASQLYRYFSVTDARFGILTNGLNYRFFSDIEETNKMDSKPFFEFSLTDFDEQKIEELKKFTKSTFELENILATASDLKYTRALKGYFSDELNNPTDDFIRFFTSHVYPGRITQLVLNQFTPIVKKALNQFIREKVNDRLQSALDVEKEQVIPEETAIEPQEQAIVTTEEEIEGFNIVRGIGRELVEVKRIVMRDQKSYCGILFDDNNRKPIIRLHFNSPQKYISLFSEKQEEKVPINSVDDIFKFAERLKSTITRYLDDLKSSV